MGTRAVGGTKSIVVGLAMLGVGGCTAILGLDERELGVIDGADGSVPDVANESSAPVGDSAGPEVDGASEDTGGSEAGAGEDAIASDADQPSDASDAATATGAA